MFVLMYFFCSSLIHLWRITAVYKGRGKTPSIWSFSPPNWCRCIVSESTCTDSGRVPDTDHTKPPRALSTFSVFQVCSSASSFPLQICFLIVLRKAKACIFGRKKKSFTRKNLLFFGRRWITKGEPVFVKATTCEELLYVWGGVWRRFAVNAVKWLLWRCRCFLCYRLWQSWT